MSDSIQQVKLAGHQGAVLCLAHSSQTPACAHTHLGVSSPTFAHAVPSCLLSGSEDSTARLWDLRAPLRASLCIRAGGEVSSVAFAPPSHPEANVLWDEPQSPFSRNCIVYLSVGNQVRGYDLRDATSPIVTAPSVDLSHVLSCSDEINTIDVMCKSRSRNTKLHMCVSEDGSSVRSVVTQADGHTEPPIVCWHDPDRSSMVTSAVYRPRAQGLELASGGTDCSVCLWDLHASSKKKRKPTSSFHITQETSGANQICNPPMVHCLSWSPSGRILAAGLGDGTVEVFGVSEGRMQLHEATRLRDGHGASVASVVFPAWYPTISHHVAAQDRLLATAGTDGAIFLWDLGASVAGDGAVDPKTVLSESMCSPSLEEDMEAKLKVSEEDGPMSNSNNTDSKLLFGIPHGKKVNWMVSSHHVDPVFPSTLFVADTSNDITAYTVPLR